MTIDIESKLKETRVFEPSPEFSKKAHIKSMAEYEAIWKRSVENPEEFWGEIASELHWFEQPKKVLVWDEPFAQWFVGGKTNITYNCLDRHLTTARKNKAALIWEGEPGDQRIFTYQQLHREVCKFANGLKSLGVKMGDRVCLYMPMIPELAIAMLGCARIGAPHSIVFGGFSAEALKDRINDAGAKIVVCSDESWRRGKQIPLKANTDEALKGCPTIEKNIVVKRTGGKVPWNDKRDIWWHDLVKDQSSVCEATSVDSTHPLFILYTSGSTGKPKGVQHSTGGYMVGTYYTNKIVFDLKEEDTYWCTADIGWVTGHSYIVYGPLANGATSVMYEGAPNQPHDGRFWEIIEKYKVNIFYTAPTAIRAFMRWGEQHPQKFDLSSLRLLGSVGEPINPEAWIWYHTFIGHERCPIVDTWWQTETGMIMISPMPGATPTKPGSCTRPVPGVAAEIVNEAGEPVPLGSGGRLVITKPWPAMLQTLYKDDQRYRDAYWSQVPHKYYAGDSARTDELGYFWIMGRLDDVLNVSGHRLGTMEIESVIVSHEKVAEAAVVGMKDDLTGEAVCAFVTLKRGIEPSDAIIKELKAHVDKEIGALARPKKLIFTDALPKTRSGKIMRRLLKSIANGEVTSGDTSTLEDHGVLKNLSDLASTEDDAT
ncbi:MAG: acetate--CoA ligase [bacterium]|nr:acetate--CoA ligase [bacterium]